MQTDTRFDLTPQELARGAQLNLEVEQRKANRRALMGAQQPMGTAAALPTWKSVQTAAGGPRAGESPVVAAARKIAAEMRVQKDEAPGLVEAGLPAQRVNQAAGMSMSGESPVVALARKRAQEIRAKQLEAR